ncbi:oxygenase MpaB family protein [Streptomyces cinnamoneus]|uniref:oxygenase MpaB family protein n=1 Tax=Streptomyces cinnamoneus TaxID=53446 RepID=UPI00340FE97A
MSDAQWPDDLLDQARGMGDPLADDAIAEIYVLGQEHQVRQALLAFGRNSDVVPDGLPPKLRRYFEESAVLPAWAEPALLDGDHGQLGRHLPLVTTTLLCGALPLTYGCAYGVEVLYRSQRLTSGVYRRLSETAQFLSDVLETGGLGPGGRALRSAQKIRLLHATMRYHLSRQEDWNTTVWGVPLNQEDLAGTLMCFSERIPAGLGLLGVDLPVRDRDSYFHTWRVVGHVLGVDGLLNPPDYDAGSSLRSTIARRQQRPSEAGGELTKVLLDFIREMLPGPALAGVGPALIRHLAGDHAADIIGVPAADFTQLAVGLATGLDFGYGKTVDTVPLAAKAANELGTVALREGLRLANKGRRREWQVPTGLTPAS